MALRHSGISKTESFPALHKFLLLSCWQGSNVLIEANLTHGELQFSSTVRETEEKKEYLRNSWRLLKHIFKRILGTPKQEYVAQNTLSKKIKGGKQRPSLSTRILSSFHVCSSQSSYFEWNAKTSGMKMKTPSMLFPCSRQSEKIFTASSKTKIHSPWGPHTSH